jgi:hypothetical protein
MEISRYLLLSLRFLYIREFKGCDCRATFLPVPRGSELAVNSKGHEGESSIV